MESPRRASSTGVDTIQMGCAQRSTATFCRATPSRTHREGARRDLYDFAHCRQRSRSAWSYQVVDGGRGLRVHDGSRNLNLTFGATVAVKPRAWATDPRPPATKSTPVTAATVAGNWVADGSGSTAPGAAPRTVSMRASTDSDTSFTNNAVHLDLSRQNGRLRIKVEGLHRIGDFRLLLSNDHWANSVSMDMADAYTQDYDGQWVDLFVGPVGSGANTEAGSQRDLASTGRT